MSFKDKYESTKDLFEIFKILDGIWQKSYKYKIGIFMYKLNNNLLPIDIKIWINTK